MRVPVGTVVDYYGSAQAPGPYKVIEHGEVPDEPGAEAAYPDGVSYVLWPVGTPRKMGFRHYSALRVRRGSFTVAERPYLVPTEPDEIPEEAVAVIARAASGARLREGGPVVAGALDALLRNGHDLEDGSVFHIGAVPYPAVVGELHRRVNLVLDEETRPQRENESGEGNGGRS